MSSRRYRIYFTRGGRPCEPYTVYGDDEPAEPEARLQIMTGSCHEGVVAPDGTVIDSRRKRAEYKKRNGVEDADDCRNYVATERAERDRWRKGEQDLRPYQEEAARAYYQMRDERRGKRR